MKKSIYMLLILCTMSMSLFAQDITVSGTVTEGSTGEPLIGVTVQIKDKAIGTMTDLDGKYTISVPSGETLVFSQVGLKKQEIIVTSSTLDVVMEEDGVLLDQVVVIGYGTVKKSHLSGAVASISAEKMNVDMYSDVSTAIQGKIPGVSVTTSDGNPANGPGIVIRGVNSLVNNSPLYIIDGAISDISMVSPNDIVSLEVLKDASSAAIYGSRAAAGVVIITTKSGKKGSPAKLTMNLSTGISMLPKKIQMLNANQWSHFAHVVEMNADGFGGIRDDAGYFQEPIFQGKGTDWQDVAYRTAFNYNLGATISGGSETATYSTSFNYNDREGIMRNTNSQSYNIRLKSDYSFFGDRLKIGQTFIMKHSKNNGYTDQNTVWSILEAVPTMPVYNSDNMGGWGIPNKVKSPNPLALLEDVYELQTKNTNFLLNAYAELRLIDELKYKVNVGLRKNRGSGIDRTNAHDLGTWGASEFATMEESSSSTDSWVLENTLSYVKDFGGHNLNLLVGYSSQKDRMRSLWGKNTDINTQIGTMPGSGSQEATSGLREHTMLSMFGRLMYSYENRYLLSASIRRDGSSRFSKGHHYGVFPSVSVGWNIHEESFAKPITSYVDQLKLRLSYGELGNETINGYYPTKSVVSQGLYYTQGITPWYGQLPLASPVSPQDLTWETTKTYNAGLDITFLNGKINLTADAFLKRTEDVLLEVKSGSSEGLGGNATSWQNVGVIDNKGVEFNIDYNDRFGEVNFSAGTNFTFSNNKVKSLQLNGVDLDTRLAGFPANGHAMSGVTVFKRGESMTSFNLLKSDGIFQNWDEINSYVNDKGDLIQPNAVPGDQRFVDYNGDGKIDELDTHSIGNPFPNFEFGIRLGADWKGFDINLFFDGVLGNDIYNYPAFRTESGKIPDVNLGYRVTESWREDNTNTSIPRFDKTGTSMNGSAYSDRWLEDGSFFRLKNLNIGYTLPQTVLSKIKLDNLRLYASFENLFTITSYSGYSPDLGYSSETPGSYSVLSRGVDHGRYPLPRTISFGIQVGF